MIDATILHLVRTTDKPAVRQVHQQMNAAQLFVRLMGSVERIPAVMNAVQEKLDVVGMGRKRAEIMIMTSALNLGQDNPVPMGVVMEIVMMHHLVRTTDKPAVRQEHQQMNAAQLFVRLMGSVERIPAVMNALQTEQKDAQDQQKKHVATTMIMSV
ncbi:MAG: hypothetical protein O2779_01315 [Nanoarchaeota archaeon]|nr:hypothetical protein [Nanoarchaeota archaeon]